MLNFATLACYVTVYPLSEDLLQFNAWVDVNLLSFNYLVSPVLNVNLLLLLNLGGVEMHPSLPSPTGMKITGLLIFSKIPVVT